MKWIWILLIGLLMLSSAQPAGLTNLTANNIERRINAMYDLPECAALSAKLDLLQQEATRWTWDSARVTVVTNRYRADCRQAMKGRADQRKKDKTDSPATLRLPNDQGQIIEVPFTKPAADPATETP